MKEISLKKTPAVCKIKKKSSSSEIKQLTKMTEIKKKKLTDLDFIIIKWHLPIFNGTYFF